MTVIPSLKEALQFQRNIYNSAFSRGPFKGVVQNLAYEKRIQFSLKFLKQNSRILDIGCGDGTVTKAVSVATASTTSAIDVSEQAVKVAQEFNSSPHITYLVSNIEDYHPGQKFDGILMFEIIEHLFQPEGVLRKLNSLLNEEGILLISTPNDKRLTKRARSTFRKKHIRIGCDHIQEFDYPQLRLLLDKAGFQIIGYEGIILLTDTIGGHSLKDVLFLQKLNFFLGSLFPSISGHIYIAARKKS